MSGSEWKATVAPPPSLGYWVARWGKRNTIQPFDNLAAGGRPGSVLLLGKPLKCTVFGLQQHAMNAAHALNEGRLDP